MHKCLLAVALLSVCRAHSAFAGIGTFDGKSDSDWTADRFSIIVGKIEAVDPPGEGFADLKVRLLPQATIGGAFDCGAEPRIEARCWYGNEALRFRPKPGMLVLALICMYEAEDFYRVPNMICPLLPDKQPLYVLKGMDDPEIPKTLERIQKARAIAKQKAEQQRKEREERQKATERNR